MRGPAIYTEAQKIYDAGMEKGIDLGRIQEREANQYETTKRMLLNNLPDDMIIQCLGISSDKLEKLKTEISKAERS